MLMNKEALEYLVNLGESQVINLDLGTYTNKPIYRVIEPVADAVKATSLTSLVDYIKSGIDDKASEQLLIHIISPSKVLLESELNIDRKREVYLSCEALLPTNLHYGRFMDVEEFNIMLQSSFVDNTDKGLLLQVTGCIQDKAVKEFGDDGVSQAVTIKAGVAKVADVVVPNPATLAPYRTFPEITQPESKFIFRMQSGPIAALFEADGGAWRNEAMTRIKAWLTEQLQGVENIRIIA